MPPAPAPPFAESEWELFFTRLTPFLPAPPSSVQRQNLYRFAEHLLHWNRVHNLIGPAAAKNLLIRHLLDSAPLLPMLDPDSRVADIGSGAGFPGLVLAILSSAGHRFDLIERAGKKAGFLSFIIHELKLGDRTRVLAESAERLGGDEKNAYDFVVSRALGSLADGAVIAAGLLSDGGRYLALKGDRHQEELDEFLAAPIHERYLPPTVHATGVASGVIVRLIRNSCETF